MFYSDFCVYLIAFRDVDDVQDMMDDIATQQDVAKEISDAISNPVGLGDDFDEDELESELEKLEQEALEEDLVKVGPSADLLPSVPRTEVVKPKPSSKFSKKFVFMFHLCFNCRKNRRRG